MKNNKKALRKLKVPNKKIYIGKINCPECLSIDTISSNPGTFIIGT